MKHYILILLVAVVLLPSCMNEPATEPDTPEGNFQALWKIIDTRYCYLDYKHINWDSIYTVYHQQLPSVTTEVSFFDLMGKMLSELKDGHVNLYSDFDESRYWKWFQDYPSNFNSSLLDSARYLGKNYRIAGGLHYNKIDNGRIGYIYYGSFSDAFSDVNVANIMNSFSSCHALIIDVRNNGGGSLNYSEQLASYFFKEKTVTGYIRHKTGNGHSDFSSPVEIVTPTNKNIQWQRPVAILTNRMSFSATNDFVNRMKQAPNAIIVGDRTGGGGGLPLSSELPNGWLVRFSSSPMYDKSMENTEFGINPTIQVALSAADQAKGIDTIIERAIVALK
ncbi:MAG: S41 family peptidase [Bacteroidota bacterium]|nr:S41 family peptidase [Bacteroidota bacterium]